MYHTSPESKYSSSLLLSSVMSSSSESCIFFLLEYIYSDHKLDFSSESTVSLVYV